MEHHHSSWINQLFQWQFSRSQTVRSLGHIDVPELIQPIFRQAWSHMALIFGFNPHGANWPWWSNTWNPVDPEVEAPLKRWELTTMSHCTGWWKVHSFSWFKHHSHLDNTPIIPSHPFILNTRFNETMVFCWEFPHFIGTIEGGCFIWTGDGMIF